MPKCNHKEANKRLLVHVADALQRGSKEVSVRTVDTDVVVILIGHFYNLMRLYGPCDVWIAFGMGKNYRCLHVNSICQAFGEQKAKALPVFHCFTGCDTTSGFYGKGKKTAWNGWKSFPKVTMPFSTIQEDPFHMLEMESEAFSLLERFTAVIYDRSSACTHVNNARRILFTKHNRALESVPPTQASIRSSIETVPPPDSFGWQKTEMSWKPVWSCLPEASKACSELHVKRDAQADADVSNRI
ncbi:hypothetical protein AC249_AIPGENE21499 [Exaiptasia diaphana]|nr:hypothetical protein AC249_AIPGENE21499 [Exaiptasia diaphana]